MNDDALERELRAWYRAEIDDSVVAPADLRDDVRAIPALRLPVRRSGVGRRPTMLLIAAAVATTAVVGSALVGSGILRPTLPAPRPSDAAVIGPTPSAAASVVAVASPIASLTPTPILGGALILAALPHPGVRPCNTTEAPFDVVTIDPATGATTLLGTTASDCSVRMFDVHWAADRTKVLLLGRYGPNQLDLATVTDAGRGLPVVCCDLPAGADVWQGGGGGGQSWTVSPSGDRIAAVHTARSDVGDAIIVSDIDGGNVRRLGLPDGADARGGFAWSPDESTIAVPACRPCNTAQRGQPATADERWQLYLVPVDGSPVRLLLSSAAGKTAGQAAWAPDGSSLAVVVNECGAGETPPQCTIERVRSSLAVVDVASGAVRTIVSGTDLGKGLDIVDPSWAPDGRRIRFQVNDINSDRVTAYVVNADGSNLATVIDGRVVAWSPDGDWFLVDRGVSANAISIGPVDGGTVRELGSFTAVDW